MALLDASLDASFWNVASQIGVVPYLFAIFRVYYCKAVEREIVTTDPDETPLVYPQAMLFTIMKEDGRLQQREPQQPLARFGAGEAHAIALAREQGWFLLINDARPHAFARSLGIRCISVPNFGVLLYAQGKITQAAAQGYLNRLAPLTSSALLNSAGRHLEQIALKRGDLP